MKPIDLQESVLNLPNHSNYKIIILTPDGIRHKRFALRVQKAFPQLVVAWYEISNDVAARYIHKEEKKIKHKNFKFLKIKKIIIFLLKKFYIIIKNPKIISEAFRQAKWYLIKRAYYKNAIQIEEKTFGYELELIKKYSVVEKQKINSMDINTDDFSEILKKYNAYFLITLGGPIIKNKIIKSVNGLALNQHAGHSPEYKGSKTIEWALYNRDLRYLSNTVHLTTTAADGGPIIRRSNICIHPDDKPQKIFLKSVALGTELMIESISDIINNENISVFNQPKITGRTYLGKEFTDDILASIVHDFKLKWLKNALKRQKNW